MKNLEVKAGHQYFQIANRWVDEKSFLASPEFKELYVGYENRISPDRRTATRVGKFDCAYLVKTDPKNNYGRSFNILEMYTTHDEQLTFVKVIEPSFSCLSSSGLRRMLIHDDYLEATDTYFDNSNSNRRKIAAAGLVIFNH